MRATALASVLALTLGALLGPVTGCRGSSEPTVATPPATPTPPPAEPNLTPPPPFPAIERPGVVYDGPLALYDFASARHGSRLASRYVLYEDGTFALQFSSRNFGFFEYAGRYAQTGSRIAFAFDASNAAGPWTAQGTLQGNSLHVTYNAVMVLADFVDGVYARSP